MQKAFKHQACLNVFDGIWKNQLTLSGCLRGALCEEWLRESHRALCPCSELPVARAQGSRSPKRSCWRSPALPGARRARQEQGGEPICKDSFQHRQHSASIYLSPPDLSKSLPGAEPTVSLCQHQQQGYCPQICLHRHTLLLSVENNPEQGISMLYGTWPVFDLICPSLERKC